MSKNSWRADRLVCICLTTFKSIFELAVTIINRNVNIEYTGQKGPEGFGTSHIIISYAQKVATFRLYLRLYSLNAWKN